VDIGADGTVAVFGRIDSGVRGGAWDGHAIDQPTGTMFVARLVPTPPTAPSIPVEVARMAFVVTPADWDSEWVPTLAVTPNGELLVAGSTRRSLTFGSERIQVSRGFYQGFVVGYDGAGTVLGAAPVTSPGSANVKALAVDNTGVYLGFSASSDRFTIGNRSLNLGTRGFRFFVVGLDRGLQYRWHRTTHRFLDAALAAHPDGGVLVLGRFHGLHSWDNVLGMLVAPKEDARSRGLTHFDGRGTHQFSLVVNANGAAMVAQQGARVALAGSYNGELIYGPAGFAADRNVYSATLY
jgi:hypothetical protein